MIDEKILIKCTTLTVEEKLVLRYFYKLPLIEEATKKVEDMNSVVQYRFFMSASDKIYDLLKAEKAEEAGS